MKVKGITQTIAENVVAYRDRKGEFTSIDKLRKVNGINARLLDAIRVHLALSSDDDVLNAPAVPYDNALNHTGFHDDSASTVADMLLNSFAVDDDQKEMVSLYGLLLEKSVRNIPLTMVEYDANRMLRVATWNMEQCGMEKVNNPGVCEVFSMTLLENR